MPRTLGQHRLALERLQRFLEAQNVCHIRDMTVDHLETFKTAGLPKEMADHDARPRPSQRSGAFSVPRFGGGGSKKRLSIR